VVNYLSGAEPYDDYLRELITTKWTAQQRLSLEHDRKNILLVSEVYAFKWPGRIVTDTIPGRSIPWVVTRYSDSLDRIAVRIRQLNVSHLVFNFVSEGHPYNANVYDWSQRQLLLWRDFMRSYAERLPGQLPSDVANGGFYIYRIYRSPQPFTGPIFYLPGIKPVRYFIREPYAARGDLVESAARALQFSARFPDVLVFKHEAGLFYAAGRQWAEGYKFLKECADAGMVGEAGYTYLAKCALHLGKEREALEHLASADRLYPDQHHEINDVRADVLVKFAEASLMKGKPAQALEYATGALGLAPEKSTALMLMGLVRMKAGNPDVALGYLIRARRKSDLSLPMRVYIDHAIEECERTIAARLRTR
jgi:tetratricopeptide (TPR) repeat protein